MIILAGILLGLLAFVGTKLFLTPIYTSTTKFYVLNKTSDTGSVTYNDLQTGTQLTKDYAELVKSRPVLEEVISVLNLDMETEELAKKITVTTPTDTRVMSINVEDPQPKQARDIADAVRQAVSIQIKAIMDVDSVQAVENANLPDHPSSPSVMKNTLIGAILGILIAAGIIILVFMLGDTVNLYACRDLSWSERTCVHSGIRWNKRKEQKTCKRALSPQFPEKDCEKVRFGRSEDERNRIELKEYAGLSDQ